MAAREAVALAAGPKWEAPGPNLALGRPYVVSRAGKVLDYALTKDEGDKTQLTDGQFAPTEKQMWWFKPTVGWFMGTVGITIDLGEVRAIGGVGYNTENGPHAGVGWPPAILILVSEDGKEYRLAGELIGLSSKFGPPPAEGRHWFRTDELKVRGRFVQLAAQSGLFVFADEIEVYQGKPDYLKNPATGPVIENPVDYLSKNIMPYAVPARLAADAARGCAQAEALAASKAARRKTRAKLEELRLAALTPDFAPYDADFRAVAPLNPQHAQVFVALSKAYRAAGYPEFMPWQTNRWARQTPFDRPPVPGKSSVAGVALKVRMMQNERRGEAVNVANFGEDAKSAMVTFSGLPGGSRPAYLAVRQAEYVAMPSRPWDADALPAAESVEQGWRVSLPAGISRQLWLDFRTQDGACPAGTHKGELHVEVENGPKLAVPLELAVASARMPDRRAATVGVWDYAHGGSRGDPEGRVIKGYGLLETNVDAAIAHMRESGVDAVWAHIQWSDADVFPCWGKLLAFDEANNLVKPPNYGAFDRWIKSRPEARYYAILGGVADKWTGVAMGTEAFNQRLTAVMKHWAAHMKEIGLDPAKIVLCLFDEPGYSSAARLILGWGEPIRAAVPEFKFYVDPMFKPEYYTNPDVLKMFDLMDIVTPGTDYSYQNHGQAAVDFYESLRQKGKIMGFYSCAQNASEADATRYYRMQQWSCWKINKGGRESWAGFWCYADTRGNLPWNPLPCGRDRNWSPVYIDSKSVTDGKHWLAIFEGVQDYEYLLMLKDRLEELRKAGRQDETVVAAQKLLDDLPDEVIAAVKAGDIGACDAGRLRVLDTLEALGK
jgi:hypothetical protein